MNLYIKLMMVMFCTCLTTIHAQSNYTALNAVEEFSKVLTEYAKTKDRGKCVIKLDNLCHQKIKCRIENDLMKRFVEKSSSLHYTNGTYLFDTYVNEILKMINNGGHIRFENIEYDLDMSKIGLVKGNVNYVKYDLVVTENLGSVNRYTDIAVFRDDKLTAIYQYAGFRSYVATLKMLFPSLEDLDYLKGHWSMDLSKAETAFSMFRKIASTYYGSIAAKSMGMVVAMEMAGVGCDYMSKYAKEIDKASYFVFYKSYPNIEKWSSKRYILNGLKYPSDEKEHWNLYKQHPYINDKGSAYFHFIYPKYRSIGNQNLPYIKKSKKGYGFVSENGKEIVDCKYSFAYPFDSHSNLAAVRNKNNKWGFINSKGSLLIPHIYDNVNDVFIDNKNFVIKDNCLILINKDGIELRRISGYNYIIPKLYENEIIAYNIIKQRYDVYDFCGNLLMEDCFNKSNMTKDEYKRYWYYYNFDWNELPWSLHDDVNFEKNK